MKCLHWYTVRGCGDVINNCTKVLYSAVRGNIANENIYTHVYYTSFCMCQRGAIVLINSVSTAGKAVLWALSVYRISFMGVFIISITYASH